jgi:hypothetical protein
MTVRRRNPSPASTKVHRPQAVDKAVDKPATRAVAKGGGVTKMAPALVPGDSIEYALTAAIKHRTKGEWWLKVGVTSVIRDGETVTTAKRRVRKFVHDMLDESANEVLT